MNIFVLDKNPELAARYHCDKHVVKMILESAQMLCTTHQVLDGPNQTLYKATHINHPCSKWVRESEKNYLWLYSLFFNLCFEYWFRYGKIHLTAKKFLFKLSATPKNIPSVPKTPFVLAMPEDCKLKNPVAAYRKYYRVHKNHIARWTNRENPNWL